MTSVPLAQRRYFAKYIHIVYVYINFFFFFFQILNAYDNDHLSFMKQVLKDPLYLEQLTGLDQMKAESEALLLDTDWAEAEDDDDEGLLI